MSIREIISKNENTKSEIFGNLINNASEFRNQLDEENESYEVIIGFHLFGYYYELLDPNIEHKRNLQVFLPEYDEEATVLLIEDYFNAKFYRYSKNEKHDDKILCSMCIANLKDIWKDSNIIFEIGRIAI